MWLFLLLTLSTGWAQQSGVAPEEWWSRGTLLYDSDRYSEAAEAFQHALSKDSKSGPVLAMLGLCEYKLGRLDSALRHIEEAQRLGLPSEKQFQHVVIYHEGLLLLEKGRFEDAQKVLDSLARDGVDTEEVKNALGEAILRFRPSRLPSGTEMMVRAAGGAEWWAARENGANGGRAYAQLVSEYGDEHNVQYAYGRYLLSQQQREHAVAAFHKEIKNTPGHVSARLAIADTLRLTDPASSLSYAEAAVRLAPALPVGHYVLGMCLLDNHQAARAIIELETAEKELPHEARIYYALARAYSSVGRKEDAARASRAYSEAKAEVAR